MLNESGMDCINYSTTSIGWAGQIDIPFGITLEAYGWVYNAQASQVRNLILEIRQGWTIRCDMRGLCDEVPPDDVQSVIASFELFPNPAKDEISLFSGVNTGPIELEIYNVSGEKILDYAMYIHPNSKIDLRGLSSGVQLIHLSYNHFSPTMSFLKQ
ncbi:MAG: T9SS C-terminal target domain-containing protein [Saprospirales bacterium]|nr:MAG: T9SS C-terminal target domain-containing protein [Saprospirales bacterium]